MQIDELEIIRQAEKLREEDTIICKHWCCTVLACGTNYLWYDYDGFETQKEELEFRKKNLGFCPAMYLLTAFTIAIVYVLWVLARGIYTSYSFYYEYRNLYSCDYDEEGKIKDITDCDIQCRDPISRNKSCKINGTLITSEQSNSIVIVLAVNGMSIMFFGLVGIVGIIYTVNYYIDKHYEQKVVDNGIRI